MKRKFVCGRCSGSGTIKYATHSRHFACNGTGKNILGKTCAGCHGRGTIVKFKNGRCTRCHGKGYIEY